MEINTSNFTLNFASKSKIPLLLPLDFPFGEFICKNWGRNRGNGVEIVEMG